MAKIIIHLKSGKSFSTEDYKINVDSKNWANVNLHLSLEEWVSADAFCKYWANEKSTFYKLEKMGSIITFSGSSVEFIEIFTKLLPPDFPPDRKTMPC